VHALQAVNKYSMCICKLFCYGNLPYVCRYYFAVKELSVLHDRHLHRPTLDDSSEEERAIEMLTDEITQVQ